MSARSKDLSADTNPKELANRRFNGARVICRRRVKQRDVITVIEEEATPGGNLPLACMNDSPGSRATFRDVDKEKRDPRDMKVVDGIPGDRPWVYRRSPAGAGDPFSVLLPDKLGVVGNSALGPWAINKGGEYLTLECGHSLTPPELFDNPTTEGVSAIHPPKDLGGNPDRDRLGRVEIHPLNTATREEYDSGVIVFGKDNVDPNRAVEVRPLLWGGFYTFTQDVKVDEKPKALNSPKGRITDVWLRESVPTVSSGRAFQMTPHASDIDLSKVMEGDLEVQSLPSKGGRKVYVTVSGLLGRVTGWEVIGEKHLGEAVLMCGPKSGLTEGRIWAVDAWVDGLHYSPKHTGSFKGWFLVEPVGRRSFSRPGDSGVAVYFPREGREKRKQLVVCGQVVAGIVIGDTEDEKKSYTLVQPIGPCLDRWKSRLLTSSST